MAFSLQRERDSLMIQQLMRFKPTEQDKEWLIDVFSSLKRDGILLTDIAMYKKKKIGGKYHLVLERSNASEFVLGLDTLTVEREIAKMKLTSESINLRFFDARPHKSN